MVKNKRKGGKKPKGGKSKAPPIQAFDLEFINKADLIKYVTLLEKEFVLMKKDCAFYSSNKEKMMEFLEAMRKVVASQNEKAVVNNSAKDEAVELMRRFPEKFNETLLFRERELVRKKLEKTLLDYFAVRSTVEDNMDEERSLKNQIAEKDKQLEFYQFLGELSMVKMKEAFLNARNELDMKMSAKLKDMLQQNINQCLKANEDFNSDKTKTMVSIWDIKDHAKESYISEMERMQCFFHEISSNNNEVIKKLRERLASLLFENRKISLYLKKVILQNRELKVEQSTGYMPITSEYVNFKASQNCGKVQNEKHYENLKFKNEVLQEQLRMEKENLANLKKQLICATRNIYQKAEFKAHILEEVIKINLQMENKELMVKEPKTQKYEDIRDEQRVGKKDDVINVLTLRVDNSDTLFVPPVYHEFWDPSILNLSF